MLRLLAKLIYLFIRRPRALRVRAVSVNELSFPALIHIDLSAGVVVYSFYLSVHSSKPFALGLGHRKRMLLYVLHHSNIIRRDAPQSHEDLTSKGTQKYCFSYEKIKTAYTQRIFDNARNLEKKRNKSNVKKNV